LLKKAHKTGTFVTVARFSRPFHNFYIFLFLQPLQPVL